MAKRSNQREGLLRGLLACSLLTPCLNFRFGSYQSRREQVPATFFVVGSRAEAYPELVKRIYAEGHDLGNHTYSHLNMAKAGPLRTRLELNATQRLIEAITGHRTALFRPPYDTDSEPETRAELAPILQASGEGYVTVAAAIDPADWFRHDPTRSFTDAYGTARREA